MKNSGSVARWLVVLSACLLWSCTPSVPYRTAGFQEAPSCRAVFDRNDEMTKGDGSIAREFERDPCWLRSMEEHREYDLLTVEFTDQGWLQGTSGAVPSRPDHIDRLRRKLEQIYNENQRNGLSIVLYVHGWQHNAAPDDRDVKNFRKFLGGIKAAEDGRTLAAAPDGARTYRETAEEAGPRVVGIYVGWRGESVTLPGLTELTFWERKNTAEHVAAGSVRELFQLMDVVHDCGRTELNWQSMITPLSSEREHAKSAPVGYRNVQMLTIGHSFGGLVTYRATSSELIGHAVTASKDSFLARTGGLVVVVNPAFEGTRYEPLHVAGQRIPAVKDNQLPTLIIATSRADWATRYAFPIARSINTVFEKTPGAEWDAAVLAVGHNERYRTHLLETCDSSKDPKCKSVCRPQKETGKSATALTDQRAAILGEAELMDEIGVRGFRDDPTYLCGGLKLETSQPPIPPHNPFWVISTSKEIMKDHNDIFNENFVSFFRQMYLGIALARKKNPAAPRCVR